MLHLVKGDFYYEKIVVSNSCVVYGSRDCLTGWFRIVY